MRQEAFGSTGLSVSVVGFGGAPIGLLARSAGDAARVVHTLLDHGVNLIDTAACYHASEELLGEVLAARSDPVVLVTKCGHTFEGATAPEWSPELIRASVARSLRRLRRDVIDVVLLHSCPKEVLVSGEAIAALVEEREAGRVRYVGYSGDNEAAAWAAGHPEIAVIETSVSIADQENIDLVLPQARARNLAVIAKRPIANAAWKRAEEQPGGYAEYARPYARRLAAMAITPDGFGIGGRPAEAWPELALRFVLSLPGIHTAIVGTTNPANARANLSAAQAGPLPAEAVAAIRAEFARARDAANEAWPGET